MKYLFFCLGIFFAIGCVWLGLKANSSSNPNAQFQPPIVEIDFEIVGGRIYVPAEINGHKTSIILDTGAGASIIDLALADELGLESSGELNAKGVGNETIKGKFLSNTKIKIGELTQNILYAIPISSLAKAEGRRLEVILGSNFFQNHIVEINYSKRHLRIFEGSAEVKPNGVAVPLQFLNSQPHINLEMVIGDQNYKLEGMIDTGATRAALTAKFLNQHQLEVRKTDKTIIGGGVGGETEGSFFRPDTIKIGNISLNKPVVALVETVGGNQGLEAKYDMNISSELLQRFRVTFDYSHKQMFLEPNENITNSFEADKTGLRINAEGSELNVFKVVGILTGSSADEAGIKPDDFIEKIDGKEISKFTLWQLRELFKSPNTAKWEIEIRRGEKLINVTVVAKSII